MLAENKVLHDNIKIMYLNFCKLVRIAELNKSQKKQVEVIYDDFMDALFNLAYYNKSEK